MVVCARARGEELTPADRRLLADLARQAAATRCTQPPRCLHAASTKKTEVTYLPDAQTMLTLAQSNGMNFLSIWAIQRDNGGCPGTRDSNTCSGIVQNTWDFSHLLEPFTS